MTREALQCHITALTRLDYWPRRVSTCARRTHLARPRSRSSPRCSQKVAALSASDTCAARRVGGGARRHRTQLKVSWQTPRARTAAPRRAVPRRPSNQRSGSATARQRRGRRAACRSQHQFPCQLQVPAAHLHAPLRHAHHARSHRLVHQRQREDVAQLDGAPVLCGGHAEHRALLRRRSACAALRVWHAAQLVPRDCLTPGGGGRHVMRVRRPGFRE